MQSIKAESIKTAIVNLKISECVSDSYIEKILLALFSIKFVFFKRTENNIFGRITHERLRKSIKDGLATATLSMLSTTVILLIKRSTRRKTL